MSATTTRPARADERSALEALQWRASLIWAADRDWLLANPDVIQLPMEQIEAGRVFVAEAAGALLGFCVVLPRDAEESELDGLFVEPGAMRAGLGARLVAQAERMALADGARSLFVIANPDAVAFYRKCGFELVGEAQTQFRPAPTLRKRLDDGARS